MKLPTLSLRTVVIGTLALCAASPAIALASGPGGGQGNGNDSTGRGQTALICDNGMDYTVAVPNPDNSNGVGQFVDEQGHLIPVSGDFTITVAGTGDILDAYPFGHPGHQNQETISCSGDVFGPLPAGDFLDQDGLNYYGITADTLIVGTVHVDAILKQ